MFINSIDFPVSSSSDLLRFEWCESWVDGKSKLDDDIFSLPHFTLAKYEHKVCNGGYLFYVCIICI